MFVSKIDRSAQVDSVKVISPWPSSITAAEIVSSSNLRIPMETGPSIHELVSNFDDHCWALDKAGISIAPNWKPQRDFSVSVWIKITKGAEAFEVKQCVDAVT